MVTDNQLWANIKNFLDSGFNTKLPDGRALRQCRLKTLKVVRPYQPSTEPMVRPMVDDRQKFSTVALILSCHMVRGWVGVGSVSVNLYDVIKLANFTLHLLLLPLDIKLDLQVASC